MLCPCKNNFAVMKHQKRQVTKKECSVWLLYSHRNILEPQTFLSMWLIKLHFRTKVGIFREENMEPPTSSGAERYSHSSVFVRSLCSSNSIQYDWTRLFFVPGKEKRPATSTSSSIIQMALL